MRGLSLKGSVRAALGEELDNIRFGDKFSGQTEGSPRARDEAEGLEPCLGWAERVARLRGHQAVLGAVGKTRETLTQLGDHPSLFSQKSQSREGRGLRTRAPLAATGGGGETELLRVAGQGLGWPPGWPPGRCECWPPGLGGVSCAWPRLSPARPLVLPARKCWHGGQDGAGFRVVGSITAQETARPW